MSCTCAVGQSISAEAAALCFHSGPVIHRASSCAFLFNVNKLFLRLCTGHLFYPPGMAPVTWSVLTDGLSHQHGCLIVELQGPSWEVRQMQTPRTDATVNPMSTCVESGGSKLWMALAQGVSVLPSLRLSACTHP